MKLIIKKGIKNRKVFNENNELVAILKLNYMDKNIIYICDKSKNVLYKSEIIKENSDTLFVLSNDKSIIAKAVIDYCSKNTFPLIPKIKEINIISDYGQIRIGRRGNKFYFLHNDTEVGRIESIGSLRNDTIDISDVFSPYFYLGLYSFAFFMYNDDNIIMV